MLIVTISSVESVLSISLNENVSPSSLSTRLSKTFSTSIHLFLLTILYAIFEVTGATSSKGGTIS